MDCFDMFAMSRNVTMIVGSIILSLFVDSSMYGRCYRIFTLVHMHGVNDRELQVIPTAKVVF